MHTELPGRSRTIETISFQRGLNGLGVDQIMGGSKAEAVLDIHPGGSQLFRKMTDINVSFLTENKGPFDDVFQFPYISGPVMGHEKGKGFGCHALYRFVL